jgi:hypothetical protein
MGTMAMSVLWRWMTEGMGRRRDMMTTATLAMASTTTSFGSWWCGGVVGWRWWVRAGQLAGVTGGGTAKEPEAHPLAAPCSKRALAHFAATEGRLEAHKGEKATPVSVQVPSSDRTKNSVSRKGPRRLQRLPKMLPRKEVGSLL